MNDSNNNIVPSRTVQALKNAVLHLYCCEDISVIGKLGSGFFATVYLVYHRPTKEKMAMKVSDEGSVQRREIELLGSLRHENVQRLYGACVVGGRLACLTEYANGGSLVDLLTGSSRLPWITRTKIANDIASGVGYLHERQLIHRDLSSQNILIRVNHLNRGSSSLATASSPCPPRSSDKEQQQQDDQSSVEDFSPTSTVTAEDKSTWLTIEQLVGYRRCSSLSPPAVAVEASANQMAASCTGNSGGLGGSLRETFNTYSLRKITPLTARSLRSSPGDVESSSSVFTESPELASAYTAIVGDLGLCLDLRQKNADLTTTVGNPYFTAPECLKKRAPYSAAADVFSFGILLCELITCLVNDGLRIPRTPVFGLDVDSLPTPPDCPPWLLDLAVRCCNVEHTCRPLVKEINQILRYHLANWCGGMNSSQSTPKPAIVEDPTLELDMHANCANPAKLQSRDQTLTGVHPASAFSTTSTTIGNAFHDSLAVGNGSAKPTCLPACSPSPPPPSISYERLTIGWKVAGRSEPPDRLESVHLSTATPAPSSSSLLDRPTTTFALPDVEGRGVTIYTQVRLVHQTNASSLSSLNSVWLVQSLNWPTSPPSALLPVIIKTLCYLSRRRDDNLVWQQRVCEIPPRTGVLSQSSSTNTIIHFAFLSPRTSLFFLASTLVDLSTFFSEVLV